MSLQPEKSRKRLRRWTLGLAGTALWCTIGGAFAQTPAPPAVASFRLESVELTGNTLLAESEWGPVASAATGRAITFAELDAVRANLEALYRARGWRLVSVRLPAQDISAGRVRMEVVEPRLSTVATSGQANFSEANLRAGFPALAAGEVPDLNALDRQLTLTNEHPAKRAQVVFLPDERPDRLRAEIRVQDNPPAGWLAFADNSGNRQTGKMRYGLAWRHGNLFDRDHQINVQVVSAPHDAAHPSRTTLTPNHNVQIFGLGYRVPLQAQGAMLDATLGYSSVDSGTLANLFRVSGRGTIAGLRYTRLMDRVGAWAPRWFVAQDYRKFENRAEFGGVNFAPDITVRPLSVGLAASRSAPGSSMGFNLGLATNLPGGDKGGAQDFNANRAGARPAYRVVRLGANYATTLGDGSLSASADAQWTDDLLISGEQFFAGGASTVRGFAERGITGDRGVRFQVEATSGNLLDAKAYPNANLRLAAFIDGAHASRNQPTVLEMGHSSIASVGLGLRAAVGQATIKIDAARPVHQRTGQSAVSGAVHVSVAFSF